MSDVRRADPSVRRQAVLVLVVGTCVGALLILVFERYRIPLSEWVLADPGDTAQGARLVVLLLGVLLLTPLLAFAAYLWSLGGRVVQEQRFPPWGLRVIRDTSVITGERAVSRGRLLKVLALACGTASGVLGLLLWRFVSMLSGHAANPAMDSDTVRSPLRVPYGARHRER